MGRCGTSRCAQWVEVLQRYPRAEHAAGDRCHPADTGDSARRDAAIAFVVAARDGLYVAEYSAPSKLYALDLEHGKCLWTYQAPDEKLRQCKTVGVSDGRVYFANYNAKLYCLENAE